MTTLLALALAYAGFTALCLAMERHYLQVWATLPARSAVVTLRAGGAVLLVLALATCVAAFPGSLGFVVWLGVLTAAAMPLVFLLPYAPRATVFVGACAPLAAALAFAWP
jgi:hypothetical protein